MSRNELENQLVVWVIAITLLVIWYVMSHPEQIAGVLKWIWNGGA